jgi:serine protease Do
MSAMTNRVLTRLATGSAAIALTLGMAAPVVTAPVWTATPAEARTFPEGFADLVEQVSPAVVEITAKQEVAEMSGPQGGIPDIPPELRNGPFGDMLKRFFDQHGPGQFPHEQHRVGALGSGFIIDPSGIVVTNNHVVRDGTDIEVTLKDGRTFPAKLLGADEKTDLAVLRIKTDQKLPTVGWGDSDKTRVGDWVLAVGNPFGLAGTVTAGIVSARGRDIGSGPYDDFIQIDAPLNSGNSGGPLLDEQGQVIGVNTAIYSPNGGSVGIGFAIPSDAAKTIVAQLEAKGHIDRGWLGVAIQPVTPEIAESLGLDKPQGALVANVMSDSPAAKAGLKSGDVVVSFAGKPIETVKDLSRVVADTANGAERSIEVWRDGHKVALNAVIAAAKPTTQAEEQQQVGSAVEVPALGLKLAPVDNRERQQFGLSDDAHGAVVVAVDDSKNAAEKGLRAGDLITRINQQPVESPADVVHAVESAKKAERKAVLLMVERNQQSRFVAIELASA